MEFSINLFTTIINIKTKLKIKWRHNISFQICRPLTNQQKPNSNSTILSKNRGGEGRKRAQPFQAFILLLLHSTSSKPYINVDSSWLLFHFSENSWAERWLASPHTSHDCNQRAFFNFYVKVVQYWFAIFIIMTPSKGTILYGNWLLCKWTDCKKKKKSLPEILTFFFL